MGGDEDADDEVFAVIDVVVFWCFGINLFPVSGGTVVTGGC